MNNFRNFQCKALFFAILLCVQVSIPSYCLEEQIDTKQNNVTKVIISFLSDNKYTIGIVSISLLGLLTTYVVWKQLNKKNHLHLTVSNTNGDKNNVKQEHIDDQQENKRQLLAAIQVTDLRSEKYKDDFTNFVNLYYGPPENITKELEIEESYYKKFEKYKGQIDPFYGNKEYQDLYYNPPLIPRFFQTFFHEMNSFGSNVDVLLPLIKMILSNELFLYKKFGIYLRDVICALHRDSDPVYRSKILETINIAVEYTNNWSKLNDEDHAFDSKKSYFHILLLFIKTAHATHGDTIYNLKWYNEFTRLQNNMINFYLNTICLEFYGKRSFMILTENISSDIELFFENKYQIPDSITDVTWNNVVIEHLENLYCEIPEKTASNFIQYWFNDLTYTNFYPKKSDILINDCALKKLFHKFMINPYYHIAKEDLDYFIENCTPPLQLENETINNFPLIYYIIEKQDFTLAQECIPSEELIKTIYDFNKNILHLLAEHSNEHDEAFEIIKSIKTKVTPNTWKILTQQEISYSGGRDKQKKPFEFAQNSDVKIFLTQIEKSKITKQNCSDIIVCNSKNTIFDMEENKNNALENKHPIQTPFPV